MKFMATLFLALSFSAAADTLSLPSCFNYTTSGQAVSQNYIQCINKNFHAIERVFTEVRFLRQCSNPMNDQINWTFTDCINDNFKSLEQEIEGLNMIHCMNLTTDRLSYSFESCVNKNFLAVERKNAEQYK